MPSKPELAYQKYVKNKLIAQGCLVFKIVEKFRSGFPDLIVIRGNGQYPYNDASVMFVEIKVEPNSLTDLQALTLDAIARKGGQAYVLTKQKDGTERLEQMRGGFLQPVSLETIYQGGD